MKYSLDTDALIKLCKDNNNIKKFLDYFKNSENKIFIYEVANEEFLKKPNKCELENYNKIINLINIEYRQWFTIGESMICGPDTMPNQCYNDTAENFYEFEYQKKLKRINKPVSREKYIKKLQSDAKIFSWSVENNCDYFVTDDKRLFKKIDKKYSTKLINYHEFINKLVTRK